MTPGRASILTAFHPSCHPEPVSYTHLQQAKALSMMLQQNVENYEQTFGEIKLDPQITPSGPIH